jgi:hypothetical protein
MSSEEPKKQKDPLLYISIHDDLSKPFAYYPAKSKENASNIASLLVNFLVLLCLFCVCSTSSIGSGIGSGYLIFNN